MTLWLVLGKSILSLASVDDVVLSAPCCIFGCVALSVSSASNIMLYAPTGKVAPFVSSRSLPFKPKAISVCASSCRIAAASDENDVYVLAPTFVPGTCANVLLEWNALLTIPHSGQNLLSVAWMPNCASLVVAEQSVADMILDAISLDNPSASIARLRVASGSAVCALPGDASLPLQHYTHHSEAGS